MLRLKLFLITQQNGHFEHFNVWDVYCKNYFNMSARKNLKSKKTNTAVTDETEVEIVKMSKPIKKRVVVKCLQDMRSAFECIEEKPKMLVQNKKLEIVPVVKCLGDTKYNFESAERNDTDAKTAKIPRPKKTISTKFPVVARSLRCQRNATATKQDMKISTNMLADAIDKSPNKVKLLKSPTKHNENSKTKSEKDTAVNPAGFKQIMKIKEEPLSPVEEKQTSPSKKGRRSHIKLEYDEEDVVKLENTTDWRPDNWEQVLNNIRLMRAGGGAPVDEMGCDKCADPSAPDHVVRYQCLISLMLSSQTKDQITYAAMQRLREHGLTIDNVINTSEEQLGKLIYPVGFWKTKAKYIKKTTQTLADEYAGDIPDTVEKLCKLTGVGPKMAHICMSIAWNKVTGIGVDTHVHRISNRIHWLPKPTKNPEGTRQSLQSWLPYKLWSEVNHLLVGFGQTICLPVTPSCSLCLNEDICPYPKEPKKTKKK